ncbi:hypothetical protein B296_00016557 [Ensete ventricosum]|uniref:Uncharacterized protein n=1 Tax=Ensete ventricosum TaxID=4639 RepID=A0A427AA70_ENSVE|nr:hypothetical protein B296_00016557 [Ensete ventricosum]
MIEAWILHLKGYPGTMYAKHLRKHTRVMIWYSFVLSITHTIICWLLLSQKTIGASLITKLRQFKGHKVKVSCSDIIIGREQERQGNELSKNPNLSSVHDLLESDWELL